MPRRTAPFGTWKSPITPDLVTRSGMTLSEPHLSGDWVYWLEARPSEDARTVIVRAPAGFGGSETAHAVGTTTQDVVPRDFNVRTRVHEYGGSSYWPHGDTVYFTRYQDQRLYRVDLPAGLDNPAARTTSGHYSASPTDRSTSSTGPGARQTPPPPRALTPEPDQPSALRYADMRTTPDGRFLVCVRERHVAGREPRNELVILPTDGSDEPRILAGGHDFFAFPRVRPDGRALAWISWDHPNMPWDGTDLWVASLDPDGKLGKPRHVAGGERESVVQPVWNRDGSLHFVSDRSGWWNLYRIDPTTDASASNPGKATPILELDVEFAGPPWVFGNCNYGFLADGRVFAVYTRDGVEHACLIEPLHSRLVELDLPFTCFGRSPDISVVAERVAFVGASPELPPHVYTLEPPADATRRPQPNLIRRSTETEIDSGYISKPRPIEFPTTHARTAHALYYPPTNRDHEAPAGELPPLLVKSHGGPTSATTSDLSLGLQYWTSRGFAVVDVNYGGSTGYGREYRERLRGNWGIVDTDDCIHSARYLVEQKLADPNRLAIRGGSAGGYTTLCALVFHDEFAAGASLYGVADLEALAKDTHKFESRYTDSLVGPYPQAKAVYEERSPARHTERLSCPLIILQGLDDPVVPPSQAEAMVGALDAKGIPYAYVTFPGEAHGFRQPANIRKAMEAESYFYGKVFGFEPADDLEEVEIKNLKQSGNRDDRKPS